MITPPVPPKHRNRVLGDSLVHCCHQSVAVTREISAALLANRDLPVPGRLLVIRVSSSRAARTLLRAMAKRSNVALLVGLPLGVARKISVTGIAGSPAMSHYGPRMVCHYGANSIPLVTYQWCFMSTGAATALCRFRRGCP